MSSPAPAPGAQLGDKPSPRPRTDLSSAFGPPNRTGGLAGRLARPARPAPAPDQQPTSRPAVDRPAQPAGEGSGAAAPVALVEQPAVAPVAAPAPAQPASAAPPAPAPTVAPRPRTRPAKATGTRPKPPAPAAQADGQVEAEGALVTAVVYVPADVLERLRKARAASGLTYTQLTLDALDGTHTFLGDLVAKATEPAARPAGSLFSGPSSAPAVVNAKVQITLRPRSSDAAVISRLASEHGTNRSQLITLALDAHLPRS